jgi:hypothetical protein
MRPLIFDFLEETTNQILENPFEYSSELNLSIDKETRQPAIDYHSLDTQTFTKAGEEPTDSDHNLTRSYLDTQTDTLNRLESSDSDQDIRSASLLDTMTGTRTNDECDDSDSQLRNFRAVLDTQTLTESKETTDSDN